MKWTGWFIAILAAAVVLFEMRRADRYRALLEERQYIHDEEGRVRIVIGESVSLNSEDNFLPSMSVHLYDAGGDLCLSITEDSIWMFGPGGRTEVALGSGLHSEEGDRQGGGWMLFRAHDSTRRTAAMTLRVDPETEEASIELVNRNGETVDQLGESF